MGVAKQNLSDFADYAVHEYEHQINLLKTSGLSDDDRQFPYLLWGAAGLGKSSGVRAIANRLARKIDQPVNLIDVRLAQFDAVDLRGCPVVTGEGGVNAETHWGTNGWLPKVERDGEFGILFLDELGLASPSVQAASLQLTLDRSLGDYVLPDGWFVVAASNRHEDRAGVTAFSKALANRFEHREIILSVDAWVEWGIDKGLREEVIAFIRFRGEELLLQHPNGVPKGTISFSTPRTWAKVSTKLDMGHSPENEAVGIEGLVGQGPAAEFLGFLRTYRKIGNLDLQEIIDDPENAPVPDDPTSVYAIACHLGRKAKRETLGAFITFLNRCSPEYAIKAVTDAVQRDEDLKCSEAYLRFKRDFIDINVPQ